VTQREAPDLGLGLLVANRYDQRVNLARDWGRYDLCNICEVGPGAQCINKHKSRDLFAGVVYALYPHSGRRTIKTRAVSVAEVSINIHGTNIQFLDVPCPLSDGGCGAEAGEKCHAAADYYGTATNHGARERRVMYTKLMWRAWM
jgi:hypothetical protein